MEGAQLCTKPQISSPHTIDFPHISCDIIRVMNKQLHFTPQASEFLTEQSAAVQKAFFEKLKKLSDDGLLREPDAKKIAPNLNAANLSIISPLQAHIHRAVSSATDKVLACV